MNRTIQWFVGLGIVIVVIRLLDMVSVNLFGRSLGFAGIFLFITLAWIGEYLFKRYSLSKQQFDKIKFEKPKTPVPENLHPYHVEILTLNFRLVAECMIPQPLSPKGRRAWLYVNSERTSVAWLHLEEKRVDFDTYFPDGFVISTQYPHGSHIDTERASFNIVTTSIQDALDFHLHHCDMNSAEHGEPIIIKNVQTIKDRELQNANTYQGELNKNVVKEILGTIFQFVGFFALIGLSGFYIDLIIPIVDNPTVNPFYALALILLGLCLALSPFIWMGYFLWRSFRQSTKPQNTVEARKAKKREAEST